MEEKTEAEAVFANEDSIPQASLLAEWKAEIPAVQSLSRLQFFVNPGTAARQAFLSPVSRSLLKLKSIESLMPSNHLLWLWLCYVMVMGNSVAHFSSCP